MNEKVTKIIKFLVPWALIMLFVLVSLDVLVEFANGQDATTQVTPLDHIWAWIGKTILASLLGIGMPLLVIGAVRNSPAWLQEWMLPNANEIAAAAKEIEDDQKAGRGLDQSQYRLLCSLAIRGGLMVLAVMIFAGLAIQRL